MKKKLVGWHDLGDGSYVKEKGPFDHRFVPLNGDLLEQTLHNTQTPTFLVTTIFCAKCAGIVDCSGFCTDCDWLTWEVEQELIKSGAPLPSRTRDRYCECGRLADYCLCHVNLAVFSPRKRK